jgi:hypothetical protein
MADAYAMLANFNPTPSNTNARVQTPASTAQPATVDNGSMAGMSLAQAGILTAGDDGKTHEGIICFKCDKTGHYAGNCPVPTPTPAT